MVLKPEPVVMAEPEPIPVHTAEPEPPAEEKPKKQSKAEIQKMLSSNVADIELNQFTDTERILELQELFKAQKLKEEVLMKQVQRLEKEKKVIDVEMGKFVFLSFIDSMKSELGLLPHKVSPMLDSLIKNGQIKKAEKLLQNQFTELLERVVKDQAAALKKWRKEK